MTDRRERQLRLLQEVARHLPRGTDPTALFDVVAHGLQEVLGEPRVHVSLDERRLGHLSLDGDDGPGDRVELVVPLEGDGLEGELRVTATGRPAFDQAESAMLAMLGDLLSGVARQGLLFEQILRTSALLARLDDLSREINTCREVADMAQAAQAGLRDMVAADGVGLYVLADGVPSLIAWDGEPDTFPQSVVVQGSSGRVLLGRPGAAPVRIGAGQLGDRPAWVELLRGGSTAALGLMIVRLGQGAPPIAEESRPLLSALAGHLAVAVHNTRLLQEMRHHATFDDLTGLAGRRHFGSELRREIDRARREGRPLSMLLLDVDHFKQVNDRWGHPAGDAVLCGLADTLREGTRSLDVVGRLGGEEIGVLLHGADEDTAFVIAERLRASVATMEVPWKDEILQVRVSIGVATWEEDLTPDDLVELSDQALYAAKAQGRDRVVTMTSLATVEMPSPTTTAQKFCLK